jgi:hypothetical protein
MSLSVGLGRSAALMVHPRAAWRTLSPRGRTALVVAYAAVSYIVTLAALIAR